MLQPVHTALSSNDQVVEVLQREGHGALQVAYLAIALWLALSSAGVDFSHTRAAAAVVTFRAIVLLLATWRASAVTYGLIHAALCHSAGGSENRGVVEVLLKGTQLALVALAALFVCDNMGISVHSLLATFGFVSITGTLSSQAVLTDAISYFAVTLDKPFEVGDTVKVAGEKMGRVESIGWKTTRVRALDGELMVFCNSDISKARVANHRHMPRRRAKFTIHLSFSTPAAFLKDLPEIARKAVSEESGSEFLCCAILGEGFSDARGIPVEITYYGLDQSIVSWKQMQHRIHVRLLESFERNSVTLARPQMVGQA